MVEMVCRRPPAGWYCTREPDHPGPCAAHPVPELVSYDREIAAIAIFYLAIGLACVAVMGAMAVSALWP